MHILLASAIALLASSSVGAVTIINGSFENGGTIGAGGFETLATGDTSITGWTVLSDGIDYIGNYWAASDGARSLDLSALASGGIVQTLTCFEIGKQYRLTFDVSANFAGGSDVKTLLMSATGGTPAMYDYERTAANSAANMQWTTLTYDFTASGLLQMIQFRSLDASPSGIALDNVSISLIPEPATWALLVTGFGLTGLALRGRKALAAVTD